VNCGSVCAATASIIGPSREETPPTASDVEKCLHAVLYLPYLSGNQVHQSVGDPPLVIPGRDLTRHKEIFWFFLNTKEALLFTKIGEQKIIIT
jgi:hypothetical protein